MPASPFCKQGSVTPSDSLRPWSAYTPSHRYMRQGSTHPSGTHRREDVSPAGLVTGKPVGLCMTSRAERVTAFHSTLIPRKVGISESSAGLATARPTAASLARPVSEQLALDVPARLASLQPPQENGAFDLPPCPPVLSPAARGLLRRTPFSSAALTPMSSQRGPAPFLAQGKDDPSATSVGAFAKERERPRINSRWVSLPRGGDSGQPMWLSG